jgi:hypothetical protein
LPFVSGGIHNQAATAFNTFSCLASGDALKQPFIVLLTGRTAHSRRVLAREDPMKRFVKIIANLDKVLRFFIDLHDMFKDL